MPRYRITIPSQSGSPNAPRQPGLSATECRAPIRRRYFQSAGEPATGRLIFLSLHRTIEALKVGGQELWLDNVCSRAVQDAVVSCSAETV